jgi:hypothetical protein
MRDDDDDDEDLSQGGPEKIEASHIPLNYQFVQNDELETMEDGSNVPLNFRFMQDSDDIETLEDGSNVPINFRFLHIQTEEGELVQMQRI